MGELVRVVEFAQSLNDELKLVLLRHRTWGGSQSYLDVGTECRESHHPWQLDIYIQSDAEEVLAGSMTTPGTWMANQTQLNLRTEYHRADARSFDPDNPPDTLTVIFRTPPHYPFTFEKRFEAVPLTKNNP